MSQAVLLQAENLTKRYQLAGHAVSALHDVCLSVDAGEFVAIMGPSGSGKSTLMNILGCLDQPTSGSYHLAGQAVAGLSADELAQVRNRLIGFVFQQFNLLPRTCASENVELPLVYAKVSPTQRRQRALAALERVGLLDRALHRPAELSGGQQQRVAIARALVNQPQLILADEPTGALDSATSEEIMVLLNDLNRQGITVIVVTHEHEVAAWARRRLVVKDGRIAQDHAQVPRSASTSASTNALLQTQ